MRQIEKGVPEIVVKTAMASQQARKKMTKVQ